MPHKSPPDLIALLQEAVQRLHKCEAIHAETVHVREEFQGKIMWDGEVEVFEIKGHPKAKRCFAWSQHLKGEGVRYVALLDLWPVTSPDTAIKASIALEIPKPLRSNPATNLPAD